MSKITIIFAAITLIQAAYGCATCGCGKPDYAGGHSTLYSGAGYIGGAVVGLSCAPYTTSTTRTCAPYTTCTARTCAPYTTCTTRTCARPVTVCRQAWQTYPYTCCTTGVSCTPTCSC